MSMTAAETQDVKTSTGASSITEGTQQPAAPKLEGEALDKAIRDQIEYYLSVDNLKTDSYLLSKMSTDMWVDIALLCRFRGLCILNADEKMVVEAMKKSKTVSTNGERTMLRPNVKVERKTIIIRDLPADADEKEVRNVFAESGDGSPVDIRSEFGGNWFVTFSSEEHCVAAHNSLDSKKFRDQPIHARIKSETLMKNFYQPMTQSFPAVYPGVGYEYFDPNAPYYGDMYQQPYGRGGRGGAAPNRSQPRNNSNNNNGANKVPKKRRANSQTQPIQLGPNHFPPLPTKKDMQDGGIERIGYGTTSFKEYSAADIIKILDEMTPFTKPDFHMNADLVHEKIDLIPVSKTPLTTEEARDVFFLLDSDRSRSISMSPFVSPFFASVPVPAWPIDHGDILGPSASPMKKEPRAMKMDHPVVAHRDHTSSKAATISTMITPPTPTKPVTHVTPAVAPVIPATPATVAVTAVSEVTQAAPQAVPHEEEKKGSFRDVLLAARKTAS